MTMAFCVALILDIVNGSLPDSLTLSIMVTLSLWFHCVYQDKTKTTTEQAMLVSHAKHRKDEADAKHMQQVARQ